MSGASGSGALGLYYFGKAEEPKYTLVTNAGLGVFRVCEKKENNRKMVIAEFLREDHARILLEALTQEEKDAVRRAAGASDRNR